MGRDPYKPLDEALLDPVVRMRKLVGSAEQLQVNKSIPLVRYYRSLLEMAKMAGRYIEDVNIEKAFVLLYRFSFYAVEELKKHPNYPFHESEEKKQVEAMLLDKVALAEKIKVELRQVYHLQSIYYQFEENQRKLRISDMDEWMRTRAEASVESAKLFKIAEEATHRCGLVMGQVMPLQVEPNFMHSTNDHRTQTEAGGSTNQRKPEPKLPPTVFKLPGGVTITDPAVFTAEILYGEIVPPKRPALVYSPPCLPGTSSSSAFRPFKPTAKTDNHSFASEYPELSMSEDVVPEKKAAPPPIIRENKPPMIAPPYDKCMAVPQDLIEKFLECCKENTQNNIETCGVLGGHSLRDRFVVTHVVLPKQSGTADGCNSDDDAELAMIMADSNLITLGWIHTHPSQTAFLSSVDLHTQHGYQQMIDASIAIVCAPSHREIGTFALTRNGMITIGDCQKRGFHTHEEGEGDLFETAKHVHFSQNLSTVVLDLRTK